MVTTQTIKLKVPYLSQHDNSLHPEGSCNATSVAMVCRFFGIKVTPDQIMDWMEGNDLDRHAHDDLVKAFKHYGVSDRFTTEATWDQVKAHLRTGNPCIYSGALTHSGHIIVLTGFDDSGWWTNDPNGEWFSWGYSHEGGEQLHYSYDLLRRCSYGDGGDGTTWAHFPKLSSVTSH